MRLVAVSIVKNEADIIEAFVRHTLAGVDHHLVFDHASTDGTREILGALQAEGLPLTLFTDDALGNLQQARSNHLTRLAAERHAADWILPLDADEILAGPGRAALETSLQSFDPRQPASLPLLDYYPTPGDDATVVNPVLRLRHCHTAMSRTRKLIIPRALAVDPTVSAGKGNHALYRGTAALPDQPLPPEFHLAHLALRSPQHQVLRVVLAELQKVSRGRAAEGLDVHYSLGYQLLAENPQLFFATVFLPPGRLRLQPVNYRGGDLRHTSGSDWSRVARALLPYLEQLAASHGRLLDAAGPAASAAESAIRQLTVAGRPPTAAAGSPEAFAGFTAREGWGAPEGPIPEAFLPPFHWGLAPATTLLVSSADGRPAAFTAECLTYVEQQAVTVELNGATVLRHAFTRVNQKENLAATLPLRRGDNELVLRYAGSLQSAHDPRALAAIFLSLRVAAP
jgi:hypothetical protein